MDEAHVTFVSSCALVDSLWYKTSDNTVGVSNSLPFLLSSTEDRLSPQYGEYHVFLDSLLRGLKRCETVLVTEKGSVQRVVFGNLIVDQSGPRIIDKPLPPHFLTFQHYSSYLEYPGSNIV